MINYSSGKGELENWLMTEEEFLATYQGKCEAIMCLGNGYMGIRSATEEDYIGQTRNCFVNGTFNKFDDTEVTELPNTADQIGMDIRINGERFSLDKGEISDYQRTLNLYTGELIRKFIWTNKQGSSFQFNFSRFVSFDDLHLFGNRVSIKALSGPASIHIKSGINGQMSNSGAQHFSEGEKQIIEDKYLQYVQTTTESKVHFVHNSIHKVTSSENDLEIINRFEMDRRKVFMVYSINIEKDQSVTIEKISNILTSRDQENELLTLDELRKKSFIHVKEAYKKGYYVLIESSKDKLRQLWADIDVKITSENSFDQLAIRFAMFQLAVMTPAHDNRCGIGAKGLSGEGYKGHSFWDTEIFILPYFTFVKPEVAQSLLEYRYITLPGARKKAIENGYRGAMYPWESAWADDGEVTPVWGSADIVTGEAIKIWSGFIEQHITSDIAFAVWQYFMTTGDEAFMEQYGYEILLDTGIFWSSRLEWNEEKKEYHINNIIGPDEYKEHVDNDAFTNYTAKWCMENAITFTEHIKTNKPAIYNNLNQKLNLDSEMPEVRRRYEKIYIPEPNQHNVIPQDDSFLSKREIDLSKYKNQDHVASIFLDYNLEQINEIQVLKQASVVMLMYLLEHKFDKAVKKANYEFYEPKTLHDSSLSLSTHAVLAADIQNLELAYDLFEKASRIDLGSNMNSSNHGLHAASLGGIWQIVVFGFGGIRMIGGKLRIHPNLPKTISKLEFPLIWKGDRIKIKITHDEMIIVPDDKDAKIECEILGKSTVVNNETRFSLKE